MIKANAIVDMSDVDNLLSEANHRRAMFYMLDSQALADMTNYVPLDQTELRTSGHVESFDTLVWQTVYAKAQYYGTNGIAQFSNYTTPGTGPYWDQVAKGHHLNDWLDAYVKGAGYK